MSLNIQYGAQLPGGLWRNGSCVREAFLRPLRGEEEAFLLDAGEALTPPARVTALLARCMVRLGVDEEITPEIVRALTAGDREALLLHLRRVTFGELLPCQLNCAHPGCGERLDLELKVSDLLVPPYASPQEWHVVPVIGGGENFRVRLRMPTGLDQELLAGRQWTHSEDPEKFLMQRCVETVSNDDCSPIPMEEWPAELAEGIGTWMSELDPQAETLVSLQCPACEQKFTGEFDAGAYLFQELRGHIPYLYREVHLLARSYHWSEAEILSMTPGKRAVYLNLLSEVDALG